MHKYFKFIFLIILVLTCIIGIKYSNIDNIILKKIYPIKYSEYVEKYSRKFNVDALLIYSIMKAESNFNENAVSSSEAKGLMQLMEATALEMANKVEETLEEDSFLDPEKNIMLGIKYYSELQEKYSGNMLLALAAYNAGIGNVDGWIEAGIVKEDGSNIENIPFKETNMYVRKIVNNYKMYKKLYVNR